MALFDLNTERVDGRRSSHAEPLYEFLNRVRSEAFGRVRALINKWLMEVPEPDRAELVASMATSDDLAFVAGFWELYLHEAHRRTGSGIEIHPEMQGSARRPDFKISRDDVAWYVEAKVTGGAAAERSADRRQDVLLDAVNEVRTAEFYLWLDLESRGSDQPGGAAFASRIERWLASLDRAVLRREMEDSGILGMPELVWQERGWSVRVLAIPKSEDQLGSTDFPVAAWGPGQAVLLDRHSILQAALRAKRPSRYGDVDIPYVIAVDVEHWSGMTDDSVLDALFGREAVEFITHPDGSIEHRPRRIPNGFWLGPSGPRNTRVSAVLAVSGIRPWNLSRNVPRLWLNPYAVRPLTVSVPWATATPNMEDGRFEFQDAQRAMSDHFELSPEWPGDIDLE